MPLRVIHDGFSRHPRRLMSALPRNDNTPVRSPDAAQRASGARLIRGPVSLHRRYVLRIGPGSAKQRCTAASRPGHMRHFVLRLGATNSSNCSSLDRILCCSTDLPVVPICRRRFTCAVGQITSTNPAAPRPRRGALRGRHERWVRGAMDAIRAADESVCRGRPSRVVLTSRR